MSFKPNWLAPLLFLFATSLLFSISFMELFATLLLIFVMVQIAKKPALLKTAFANPANNLHWILGALLLWTAISLVANGASLVKLMDLRWMLWLYLFFFCFSWYTLEPKSFKWLNIPIWISSVYAVIFFLSPYEPLKGPEFVVHNIGGFLRSGGFLGSPMTFGNAMAPLFCFFLGLSWYFWNRREQNWIWILISTGGFLLSLLLSFTRGAWIGAFVGALVMVGFMSRKLVLVLIVATAILTAGLAHFSSEFRGRLATLTNVNAHENMGRQSLWRAHFEMVKDHPLLGVGYGKAKGHLDEYYERLDIPQDTVKSHAHNQPIHFAAGMGIPGVLLLVLFWLSLLVANFRLVQAIPVENPWHKALALGLLGSQVSFYILNQTEAAMEDSEVTYAWTFLMGILLYLLNRYNITCSFKSVCNRPGTA